MDRKEYIILTVYKPKGLEMSLGLGKNTLRLID